MYQDLRGSQLVRKLVKSGVVKKNPVAGYAYKRRIAKKIANRSTFPMGLLVETINACNARCTMCPYPSMTRPKGTMDWDLYKRIVDEVAQHDVRRFQLNATNEPLLDPQIMKRIRYAKDKGIQGTRFFSNGSLLTEEKGRELLKSGLELMIISLDGATKETYESIRINLNYDVVVGNITRFLEMRKAEGLEFPKVELHMTVSQTNKEQADQFVKQFKPLADVVTATVAHDWAGQTGENNPLYVMNNTIPQTPCRRLWYDFNILWDGRVCLCCLDYDGKVILGNVNDQSIAAIWNGPAYDTVRTAHVNGEQTTLDLCNTCNERISWWRSDSQ